MSYLAVVVVVGLVIAIHECGHLLAAKWCGIPIDSLSGLDQSWLDSVSRDVVLAVGDSLGRVCLTGAR